MPEITPITITTPELSRVLKSLCSETALKILFVLRNGPQCVGELALSVGISSQAASNHLKSLWGVRIVNRTRKGQRVVYSLDGEALARICRSLGGLGSESTI